jgi:hypothetical protein
MAAQFWHRKELFSPATITQLIWNPYHFPQILHLSPWLADRDNAVIEDTAAIRSFDCDRFFRSRHILSRLDWVRRKLRK